MLHTKSLMSRPTSRSSDPSALLLAPKLDADQVAALLEPYGLTDIAQADANIQAMAGEPRTRHLLAKMLGDLLESVAQTADPDQALNRWERFLQTGINRAALFEYLHGSPRMLHLLCTIFGNSESLAQTLIRDPLLVYWLVEEQVLTRRPTRASLDQALRQALANLTTLDLKLEALRRFRRREMLRIGVRDLLGLDDVPDTTAALSDLATVLIQAAYEIVEADLRRQCGVPMHRDAKGRLIETKFAVIGMGKLGGGELNYSSDVDLIFVYASDAGGTREGCREISNEEYFEQLARRLTQALAAPTQEGRVFRVDLRLRAEGSVGRLARSLEEYAKYYRTRGEVWERLALLKAWPIAGSREVGRAFLRVTRPFVLNGPQLSSRAADVQTILKEVRAVKEQINGKMADRGHERRNVKLGIGGIREIEFLVQTIQVICGKALPRVLDRNTLGALARFRELGLLSAAEQSALVEAYVFLRDVEHKLQMVHDLQTHALPDRPDELMRCAIRLGYAGRDRKTAADRFTADYRRHTDRVNTIFRRFFYATGRSRLLQAILHARKQAENATGRAGTARPVIQR